MTFIDLFSGYGGFSLGFEKAGFKCIGHCEIDKHANKSYDAINGIREGEWFASDISRVRPEELPQCDIITAGFPCQNISVAGRGGGLSGERSALFFEIIRLIAGKNPEDRPRWVVLENVKNLLSVNEAEDFTTVLCSLSEIGYDCEYQVLNSKDFGVPQNRERVFIVGHLRGRCRGKVFPLYGTNSKDIIQLVSGNHGQRVYDPDGISITLTSNSGGQGAKTGLYAVSFNRKGGIGKRLKVAHALNASNYRGVNRNQSQTAVFIDLTKAKSRTTINARCLKRCYNAGITNRKADKSGVLLYPRAVLTPERETKRQNGRRMKEPGEPMFTLTSQDRHGVAFVKEATKKGYAVAHIGDSINLSVPDSKTRRGRVGRRVANTLDTACNQAVITSCFRIRRLTPRECFRLQGVSDKHFEKAQAVNSDTQLYKQAGNGVTVNVVYEIAKKIMKCEVL